MYIESMEVTNWRALRSHKLSFAKGITIIGGANETGKSSLRGALRAALLLPTRARNEAKLIEANRPWNTALNPKVKLTFEVQGKTCIVEKEFLRKKEWASLDYAERRIAEDGQVQDELLKILGPSAEWIDVLWGEQGQLTVNKDLPDSVKGHLAAAAEDTVMPEVATLEELIETRFDEFWTATKRPKKTVIAAREATQIAEDRVADMKKLIVAAEERSAEMDKLAKQLEAKKESLIRKQAELKKGQDSLGAWDIYAKNNAESEKIELERKTQEQWLGIWVTALISLVDLKPKSLLWQATYDELRAKSETAPTRNSITLLSLKQNYLELNVNAEKYAQAESISVPEQMELNKIKTIASSLQNIEAALKMGELHASLRAEKPLQFSLSNDGKPKESFTMEDNSLESWSSEKGFELQIPGVATFKVEAGSPEILSQMNERAELQATLTEFLKKWDSATLSDLQDRITSRSTSLLQITKVDKAAVAAARASLGDAIAVELDALHLAEKESLLKRLPAEIAEAERKWKQENDAHQLAQKALQEHLQRNYNSELSNVLKSMNLHCKEIPFAAAGEFSIIDEVTDEWLTDMQARTQTFVGQLETTKAQAQEATGKLIRPEGEEVSKDGLAKLQKEIEDATADSAKLSERIAEMKGEIKTQGDLHSKLVEEEERQAKAEAEQARIDLDAYAILRLKDVFTQVRSQLQADIVAPLTAKVTDYFNKMTSGIYDDVAFDTGLRLSGVGTSTIDKVSVDEISFGAREQLFLLTRLALAELLSKEGQRQIVILDDNLVHTDDKRMQVACRMLEEASASVQIIIFTCHPERYKSIATCAQSTI